LCLAGLSATNVSSPASAASLSTAVPVTMSADAGGTAGTPHKPAGSRMTLKLRWPDDAGTDRVGRVTVSKTQNLYPREIVTIDWSGFLPTLNADGPESTHQAPQAPLRSGYPVVILECQGDDAAKMTPQDCPIPNPSRFYYYATKDALETPEVQAASPYDSRSFLDTKGKLHVSPGTYQNVPMPSDYSDENVSGTNWIATWTEQNGDRSDAKFEVRTTQEAPQSLGCGDPTTRLKGACSIVVIPIRPMDCIDDTSCLAPTQTNGFSADYHEWQSASNWRNKFVFPVTFKPFPSVCDLDDRPALPTAGSQLLDQAMLSWVPKFCQSKSLFKLTFTRINDDAARRAITTGVGGLYQADLAFSTLPVGSTQDRPIVNAPVAVTGFAVALAIDNKGYEEVDDVRLNARLLAKLVTESYYAPPVPYLEHNPSDLLHDPEFRKLNPKIWKTIDPSIQINNPVMVQGSPDLVEEVTRYIASDKPAVAWLNGKPDPWGMVVNKNFEGEKWPVPNTSFQLRDAFIDKKSTSDEKCSPKPVLEQESQFVYNLLAAAVTLVDRQPQSYSVCAPVGQSGRVWAWGRPARQPMGQRSMVAITDYAHAEEYQLPEAALRNAAGKYVTPTPRSLNAALRVATVDPKTKTYLANMTSKAKAAYPGLMVVNAAAPTSGLDKSTAGDYARMIKWMVTKGQTYGDASGQLPAGYLALPRDLQKQALAAARHVRNQDSFGALPPPPPPEPTPTPPTSAPTTHEAPGGSGPTTPPPPTTSGPTTAPTTPPVVAEPIITQAQTSDVSRNVLPILIAVGCAGLVLAPLLMLTSAASRRGGYRVALREALARLPRRTGR
jgi:ABC-type phosphate transport system substrate-binding protein